MRKGKIDNITVDAIGRALIRQAFDRQPDIEKIVADPYLFARVKARINAGDDATTAVVSPFAKLFSLRSAVVGGIAAVLIAATIGLSFLSSGERTVANHEFQVPPQKVEVARPLDPPQVNYVDKLSQSRATDFESPRAENVAARSIRTRSSRPIRNVEFDSDGEFYPVAYSGDIEDTATGGRVIRVDMDRSSLFALGVNLPLENDAETIKADLLVGRDGVTRAVRLVK